MAFLGFIRFGTRRLHVECLLPAALALGCTLTSMGCGHSIVPQTHAATVSPAPSESAESPASKQVRATGTIEAIHSYTVQTPQIAGQGGQLTLTALAPTGTKVAPAPILPAFDPTLHPDTP